MGDAVGTTITTTKTMKKFSDNQINFFDFFTFTGMRLLENLKYESSFPQRRFALGTPSSSKEMLAHKV
jgi:hypothetical protein